MWQSSHDGTRRTGRIVDDLRHWLPALGYVAMLYWLSSRPELGTGASDQLVRLAANLYHIPLYAGLGFFLLQVIARGQALATRRWLRAALTFAVTAAFAALDEWHQAFVPHRDASFSDFLLDLAGVAGLLLICTVGAGKGAQP